MKQVVVISGPTGSGESTLTRALIERFPGKVSRLVTSTTRAPRTGELEGIDYYFFTKEDFEAKHAAGLMLEVAYIENRDTYYGTYGPDLEARLMKGDIVIANTQIVGTKFFKANYDATTIFIVPESVDVVMNRIRARSPELSEEEFAARRKNAEKEIEEEGPFYDYKVVNADGKLEEAIQAVIEILKKEGYDLQ